jgi:hypothetical protein
MSPVLLGNDRANAESCNWMASASGFGPDIRRSLVQVRTRIRRRPRQPGRTGKT